MSRVTAGGRRPLLVLLVLFLAPLAVAFWLYYGTAWRPAAHTNHGELIEPARPLPQLALERAGDGLAPAQILTGKWSLVVVGTGAQGCDAACRETLIYARQTWLSLGKFLPRAQRVLLAGEGCCDLDTLKREHLGLIALRAAGANAAPVLQQFPPPLDRTIFIVDPLGNLMMRYDVRADPKGLREDLKKLLDLSHIG